MLQADLRVDVTQHQRNIAVQMLERQSRLIWHQLLLLPHLILRQRLSPHNRYAQLLVLTVHLLMRKPY